jgi:hypothetical protein
MMLRRFCPRCAAGPRGPCPICPMRGLCRASAVRARRGPDPERPMIWPLAMFRRPAARGSGALLSMHELTALMVLQRSPGECELDRADLESLSVRKMVTFEMLPGGKRRPRITAHGADWLAAVMRGR